RSGWFHGKQHFWSQMWEMLKVSMATSKTTHHNDLVNSGEISGRASGGISRRASGTPLIAIERHAVMRHLKHRLNLEEGCPIQPWFLSPIHHKMWR
ncbi:unnamed protein product, partial [Brassica oleracea var. botrytis]